MAADSEPTGEARVRGPFVVAEGLAKSFGSHQVLDAIGFEVARGEVFALLGPSGTGKTTLLRLLAGFESPDRGTLEVDGVDVTGLAPARRGFGLVFQSYALFPHLDIAGNVGFGLEAAGWERGRARERIAEVLELVDLAGFQSRKITEISGGQQQRVALARALASNPPLLLLDEPLSNLDPALRERTRAQLRESLERVGITTILVTHEQEEAFELGHRVGVLGAGELQQVDAPRTLYERPATRFVAGFVGRSNWLPGVVEARDGDGWRIALDDGPRWSAVATDDVVEGQPVELMVRPEALRVLAAEEVTAEGLAETLAGEVRAVRYSGPTAALGVALSDGRSLEVVHHRPLDIGSVVTLALRREAPTPRLFPRPDP